MCVVAELRPNQGSALVVADPAKASVRTDPALEAAGLCDFIGFEKRCPYQAPESNAGKK
jgi:hypothetical protein